MMRGLLITLMIVVWSADAWAKEFYYQADVEGMVCAFCAYNVNKKVGSLPGIEADSVNVDLENGHVDFKANRQVSRKSLDALFTESGFSIVNISEIEVPPPGENRQEFVLVLDMKLNSTNTDQFETLFEAVGNIAAGSRSKLVIEAPASLEKDLLKPILMGRQQVMKVRFNPRDTPSIHLQLYLR